MAERAPHRLERDMTPDEIEAATGNPDVDWGWIDCGPRHALATLWRRVSLWARIVGRVNQADYRTGPLLAWTICAGVWPAGEAAKAWGIVADRREMPERAHG